MDNLYRIVKSVKPRRILLTSYTFSADWFESTLYPLLRQDDCEAIVVMVDAKEAHRSIDNTQSKFGGSRYRVVSATGAPSGIFHPKVAYLETANGDVLVVGSGNLTAAGQGGQLEVLDAVCVTTEPEVFEEFSHFLKEATEVAGLSDSAERNAVMYFSERALGQANAHSRSKGTTRSAYLVSSLGKPAGVQLAALVKRFVPLPTSLTVLSPYHDKDAAASVALHNKIRSKKLQFALAKNIDGKFLAPFSKKKKADPQRSFVTPLLPPDKNTGRPLHAKWFDISNETGMAVSMTGSVNSTFKSLWSTDNVELALARVISGARPQIWKSVKDVPIYEPCEFPKTVASDTTVLCKANLNLASQLEIEFSPQPAYKPLRIRLFQGHVTHYDKGGVQYFGEKLVLNIPGHVEKSLCDGALWVEVAGEALDEEAFNCQSWVNVEQELEHKPTEVDVYKAMNRLEHGTYSASDEHLLLAAIHFELTGNTLNKKRGSSHREGTEVPDEQHGEMTKAELERNHSSRGPFAGQDGASKLLRTLRLLAQKVNAADVSTLQDDEDFSATDSDGVDGEQEENDAALERDPGDNDAEKRRRKRNRDSIEAAARAKQALSDAIDKAFKGPLPESKANWLIPYELGRNLQEKFPKVGARHTGDGLHVGTTLLATVRLCSLLNLEPVFKQNFFGTLACAAAAVCLAHKRLDVSPPYDEVLSILDGFAGRPVDVDELLALPHKNFPGKAYVMLDQYDWNDLLPELASIGGAMRLGGRIDQLLKYGLVESLEIPEGLRHAEISFVTGLKRPLQSKYKLYAIVPDGRSLEFGVGCPQCHQRLSNQEARRLKEFHIAMCEATCRRPIIERIHSLAIHRFYREEDAWDVSGRKMEGNDEVL